MSAAITISFTNLDTNQVLSGTRRKITVVASDPTPVYTVKFYVDGELKHIEYALTYDYFMDTTGFQDGSHVIKALAADRAGNSLGSTSRTVIVQNKASWLYDDFQASNWGTSSDSYTSPDGKWKVGYISQGRANVLTDSTGNKLLQMSPAFDKLRATKLYANAFKAHGIHGKLRVRLDAQLSSISWYCPWPLLAYLNETTHIYFNLKTNGWEIGKKDNDKDPALELQEYIAQGSTPKVVIGQWYTIEWWVVPDPSGNLMIRVDVNGTKIWSGLDNQPWQRGGLTGIGTSKYFLDSIDKMVALYQEGSQCSWDDVYLEPTSTIPTSTISIHTGVTAQDKYDDLITKYCTLYGFAEPMWVKAQIHNESFFDTFSISSDSPCGIPTGWTDAESKSFGLQQTTPACTRNPQFLLSNGHPDLAKSSTDPNWSKSVFNPDHHLDVGIKELQGVYSSLKTKYPTCSVNNLLKMTMGVWNSGYESVTGCGIWSARADNYINLILGKYTELCNVSGYPNRFMV